MYITYEDESLIGNADRRLADGKKIYIIIDMSHQLSQIA